MIKNKNPLGIPCVEDTLREYDHLWCLQKEKITGLFTLRESRGYRISCVVKGLRQLTTASPLTPWIFSTLDFCNVRVNSSPSGPSVRP